MKKYSCRIFFTAIVAAFMSFAFVACIDDSSSSSNSDTYSANDNDLSGKKCSAKSKGLYVTVVDTFLEDDGSYSTGREQYYYCESGKWTSSLCRSPLDACTAENEGEKKYKDCSCCGYSIKWWFICKGKKWKILSGKEANIAANEAELAEIEKKCPSADAKIGDVCVGDTYFLDRFVGDLTPHYIYTSLGWTSFSDKPVHYGFCKYGRFLDQIDGTVFTTLVLDSDTDHPRYKFAIRDLKWDWPGCDIENGEVCNQAARLYIKSNGEFDKERSFVNGSIDDWLKGEITETCDSANIGKRATVSDSIVFPNGQVIKKEGTYVCVGFKLWKSVVDPAKKAYDPGKEYGTSCTEPDTKSGDVCALLDSSYVPIQNEDGEKMGYNHRLECYEFTEGGWEKRGGDNWKDGEHEGSCEDVLDAPKISLVCNIGNPNRERKVDNKVYHYECSGDWLVYDIEYLADSIAAEE